MKRPEVDKIINDKIEELYSKGYGDSKAELTRELIVAGIRVFPGQENFLSPYPSKT